MTKCGMIMDQNFEFLSHAPAAKHKVMQNQLISRENHVTTFYQ